MCSSDSCNSLFMGPVLEKAELFIHQKQIFWSQVTIRREFPSYGSLIMAPSKASHKNTDLAYIFRVNIRTYKASLLGWLALSWYLLPIMVEFVIVLRVTFP
jgi:hypothetical protein